MKDRWRRDAVQMLQRASVETERNRFGARIRTRIPEDRLVHRRAKGMGGENPMADLGAFRAALLSPDPLARREALRGLSGIRTQESTDLIAGALADPDPGVRRSAGWFLAGRNDPRATPELLRGLAEGDARVAAHLRRFVDETHVAGLIAHVRMGPCASAAVDILHVLLRRSARTIHAAHLKTLARLAGVQQAQYIQSMYNDDMLYTGSCEISCEALNRLAREELERRKGAKRRSR